MKLKFNEDRLRCLYVSARLGTMRAAADKLNLAASSVSRQIHKLETELDIPLIEKGRHRIKLTQAGQVLVDYFEKRSQDQEELSDKLEDIKALRTGNITIAIVEGFVGGIISPTISDFISKYSNIYIDVRMLPTTREVIEMVVQDDAHFGVAFDAGNENRIHTRPAIEQPIKAIVHPEHPLANRKKIKLAELKDSNIILNQNYRMQEVIRNGASHENTNLNIVMTTNSFVLLKNCVMNGNGITFLSDLAVAQEISDGKLVSLTVDNPVLNNSIAVVITRVGRQLPTSANRLLRSVQDSLVKWDKAF